MKTVAVGWQWDSRLTRAVSPASAPPNMRLSWHQAASTMAFGSDRAPSVAPAHLESITYPTDIALVVDRPLHPIACT